MKKTDIIFIKVADNKTKVQRICECIHYHFSLGHKILVTVANMEVAKYMDDLLWRFPEESFLPHKICANSVNEHVAIAVGNSNINKAQVLLNLQPDANPLFHEFETVYDLMDESHLEKLEQSKKRMAGYPKSRTV